LARVKEMLAWVNVPERHRQMMSELRDALKARLKLDLEADARVDSRGTLLGRIFVENVHFGAEFNVLQVKDWAEGLEEECEVSVRTELLPGVNDFAKYFPFTKSNKVVREVDKIARETIARSLGKSANVIIDNTIGINAAYLAGTVGVLGAFFGGAYGFLLTASGVGGLEGAAVGGALGAGAIMALIFRALD
jgi:hypothetical protein